MYTETDVKTQKSKQLKSSFFVTDLIYIWTAPKKWCHTAGHWLCIGVSVSLSAVFISTSNMEVWQMKGVWTDRKTWKHATTLLTRGLPGRMSPWHMKENQNVPDYKASILHKHSISQWATLQARSVRSASTHLAGGGGQTAADELPWFFESELIHLL